jgi:hypothetical protein
VTSITNSSRFFDHQFFRSLTTKLLIGPIKISTVSDKQGDWIMDNIITIAQTSVAVMQFSVAAGLLGAAAFSTWKAKH